MRRPFVVACVVSSLAAVAPARAQEILLTGPLAGAPVGRLLWRERRFEIAAASGVRASGGASSGAVLASELRYHPWERVGVGIWGGGVLPLGGECSQFCSVVALPELAVVPLAGRSRWLAYQRYDVHLLAAPAWVWPTSGERSGRHLAASVGAGFRLFHASSFSSSLDYRALVADGAAHVVTLSLSWWLTRRRWDTE
jgi:hypothetical protein